MIQKYQWSQLNTQQVGAYTEYFVKMELTMYGFQVYETEVGDHGSDYVTRYRHGPFIEIQVKSLRKLGYVFMEKTKFELHPSKHLAFGLLLEGQAPNLYLIPSTRWLTPSGPFVNYDYVGRKSKPEHGLQVSKKYLPDLALHDFLVTVEELIREADQAGK